LKIWRYVDLGKFVSMLATGSLYFTCPCQFEDPFEGWLPRSHLEAYKHLFRGQLEQIKNNRNSITALYPDCDRSMLNAFVQDAEKKLDVQQLLREVNNRFCWDINEGESDAMWKLYGSAGGGIAIQSSKAALEAALKGDGIIIDRVRYMDFDEDEIEKGHRHYGLFIKRNLLRMSRSCGPLSFCLSLEPGRQLNAI
jgi:hypothetical protein